MEILELSPEFGLEEDIIFNTDISESETGRQQRNALWDFGLRSYNLALLYYTQEAMDAIWNFFIARKGAFEAFLVKIPTEYQVTGEIIGTGDGKEATFLLDEFPVDTSGNFTLYVNGVAKTGTLSNNTATEKSYATFTDIPASGALTADYEFFFKLRFAEDRLTRKLMSYKLLNSDFRLMEDRWPLGYTPRAGNVGT